MGQLAGGRESPSFLLVLKLPRTFCLSTGPSIHWPVLRLLSLPSIPVTCEALSPNSKPSRWFSVSFPALAMASLGGSVTLDLNLDHQLLGMSVTTRSRSPASAHPMDGRQN